MSVTSVPPEPPHGEGERHGDAGAEGRGPDRQPRRRLPVTQRREELVAAALRLFGTRPADEVSTDEIAAEAGASRALIYHYFGSKQDLYLAVVRSAAADLVARLLTEADAAPWDRFRLAVGRYLDFAEEYASSLATLLRSGMAGDASDAGAILEQARTQVVERLLQILGRPADDAHGPFLRSAVRGWMAAAERVVQDWLEQRDMPRPVLEQLLAEQFAALLAVAARHEPRITPLLGGAGWPLA